MIRSAIELETRMGEIWFGILAQRRGKKGCVLGHGPGSWLSTLVQVEKASNHTGQMIRAVWLLYVGESRGSKSPRQNDGMATKSAERARGRRGKSIEGASKLINGNLYRYWYLSFGCVIYVFWWVKYKLFHLLCLGPRDSSQYMDV